MRFGGADASCALNCKRRRAAARGAADLLRWGLPPRECVVDGVLRPGAAWRRHGGIVPPSSDAVLKIVLARPSCKGIGLWPVHCARQLASTKFVPQCLCDKCVEPIAIGLVPCQVMVGEMEWEFGREKGRALRHGLEGRCFVD